MPHKRVAVPLWTKPEILLATLQIPNNTGQMQTNEEMIAAYLGILCENPASPEEVVVRIRSFSVAVATKMAERPENRHDYALRHWLFCDGVRRVVCLPELDGVLPQDFGLTPYFPVRERHLVGGKLKPRVSLNGVSLPLISAKILGFGQFGVVKENSYDGGAVAIKRVVIGAPSGYDWETFLDSVGEAQLLMRLNHANIVRCVGFFMYGDGKSKSAQAEGSVSESPNVMKFALVLERVRPIHHRLFQKWPMTEILRFFFGLGTGLAFLHDHDLVHGDVKVANSGVSESGVAKLLDFGFWNHSTVTQIDNLRSSPEQLGGTYPSPEAIAQRALWSCGVDHAVMMKPLGGGREAQTLDPPYLAVGVSDFATISLKGLDVFAFGVSLYEAVKMQIPVLDSDDDGDLCPAYRPKHHNFNFVRDKVVMNGRNTKWKPNPVFGFLQGVSMFSTVYPIVCPELTWVGAIVAGCLAEDPSSRWSMDQVLGAFKLGLFGRVSEATTAPVLVPDPLRQATVAVDDLDWDVVSVSSKDTDDSWVSDLDEICDAEWDMVSDSSH